MYTDWIPALDGIKDIQNKTILELGLGAGTQTLISRFKRVISFEVARTDEWYNNSVAEYSRYPHWSSRFISMKDLGLDRADDELLKSGGRIRNTEAMKAYFAALESFVPTYQGVDVAFVDQGFHFRGETVTYFLEKGIGEIIAHDTFNFDHIYGYDAVKLPSNYVTYVFGGLGTTLYVKVR